MQKVPTVYLSLEGSDGQLVVTGPLSLFERFIAFARSGDPASPDRRSPLEPQKQPHVDAVADGRPH